MELTVDILAVPSNKGVLASSSMCDAHNTHKLEATELQTLRQ